MLILDKTLGAPHRLDQSGFDITEGIRSIFLVRVVFLGFNSFKLYLTKIYFDKCFFIRKLVRKLIEPS